MWRGFRSLWFGSVAGFTNYGKLPDSMVSEFEAASRIRESGGSLGFSIRFQVPAMDLLLHTTPTLVLIYWGRRREKRVGMRVLADLLGGRTERAVTSEVADCVSNPACEAG